MFRSFAASALLAVSQASQLPGSIYDSPHLHPFVKGSFAYFEESDSSLPNAVGYPGDNCCAFYEGHNYEGANFKGCLPAGKSSATGDVPSNFAGKVSSWYCGKGVRYGFCFGSREDGCWNNYGQHGAGNSMSGQIGENDRMKWWNLTPYDPVEQGSVTMFTGGNCTGRSGRFDAGDVNTTKQKYALNDFYQMGLPNDSITSVMVPEGYTLRLWNGSFGQGNADYPGRYTDNRQAMACKNLSDLHFDNITSSIEVIRTKQYKNANSFWVKIQAQSQPFTGHVHYGHSTTSETQSSKQSLADLKYEESIGIKFAGIGVSETMSSEFQQMVSQSTNYSSSFDFDVTWDVDCGPVGTYSTENYGLWQYVVQTNEGLGTSWLQNTICRTGALFNEAPKCPYDACVGGGTGECTECKPWY